MSRRLARELALKMLYSYESGRTEIDCVLNETLNKKKYRPSVKEFSKQITTLTINNIQRIDEQIKNVVQNWEYNRVATIDKLILRLGVCEFLFFDDIPYEVTINEALELAKKFGTDDSKLFVNGILDAVLKKMTGNRKNESSNNK